MNILQFLIGQIGDGIARQSSIALLLDQPELPGGPWVTVAQRSWRTGLIGSRSEVGRRARRAGTFTALRRFRQDAPFRGLFVQVMVTASQADAESMVPNLGDQLLSYRAANITGKRTVEDVDVPEIANPWLYELSLVRKQEPSSQKLIGGSVAQVAFVVSGSGFGEGWSWTDVAAVATLQNSKIKRLADRSDHEGLLDP